MVRRKVDASKGKKKSGKSKNKRKTRKTPSSSSAPTHRSARADSAQSNDRAAFPAKLKQIALPTEETCRIGFSADQADLSIEKANHFLIESCLECKITVDAASQEDMEGQGALIDTGESAQFMATSKGYTFGSANGRLNGALGFARETVDMAKLARFIKKRAMVSLVRVCEATE